MQSLLYSGKGLNNIETIENELISKSKTLSHLDLSNNHLYDFNTKVNFNNLQSLILDHNYLSTIKNFPTIKTLDTLSLCDNNFTSPMEFSMYCVEKVNLIFINVVS
jgi:hypothetical protein